MTAHQTKTGKILTCAGLFCIIQSVNYKKKRQHTRNILSLSDTQLVFRTLKSSIILSYVK